MPFGVVVLAAGSSSRLGRPKQLLPYLGKTLVEHAVRTAIASGASEVVVVLGSHAAQIRSELRGLKVRIVVNRDWEEGMGSSIRCGVAALSAETDRAVVALADQPRISPAHLRELAARCTSIAASSYDGVVGAPCAFTKDHFPALARLSGDEGARSLIRGAEGVVIVEFAAANIDVDTPEDYRALVPEEETAELCGAEATATDVRAPPTGLHST